MLIRCTLCETELIVSTEPSSFKCRRKTGMHKECGHDRWEPLRINFPELFSVRDGGSFLHGVRDGKVVFKTDSRALFFIQEDAEKVIKKLAALAGKDSDYYRIESAAWERGSEGQIKMFEDLWPNKAT